MESFRVEKVNSQPDCELPSKGGTRSEKLKGHGSRIGLPMVKKYIELNVTYSNHFAPEFHDVED